MSKRDTSRAVSDRSPCPGGSTKPSIRLYDTFVSGNTRPHDGICEVDPQRHCPKTNWRNVPLRRCNWLEIKMCPSGVKISMQRYCPPSNLQLISPVTYKGDLPFLALH
jgi:hypothetical protein